ncbi:hypothetical protein ACIQV0_10325 [Lysinibacillus capsici]|uniref:hypothetical protein n=1 Tax=Lysinibacillus TaxID=400634 RepID=UPI0006540B47|nr:MULTISPECIES: hypothetical protein [Lysinibacillus]KMN41564.1 hypothetical protein VK91_00385 [Lysinibacillus sp. LK3]MED4552835.1 hypothetical protein [Lysinibacillus capsici]
MKIIKNDKIVTFKIDRHAMALGYQEMGDLNLQIAVEMDHLEWEAYRIIEGIVEKTKILDIY